MDNTGLIPPIEEEQSDLTERLHSHKNELQAQKDQSEEVEATLDSIRTRLIPMIPSYNDECLSVDFQESWSVDRNTCQGFNSLFQQHSIIEQGVASIRELKIRLSRLRSAEWREHRATEGQREKSRIGSKAWQQRESMKVAQCEMDDLQDAMRRSRRWFKTLETRMLEWSLRPFLIQLGRIDGAVVSDTGNRTAEASRDSLERPYASPQDRLSAQEGGSSSSQVSMDEVTRLVSGYEDAAKILQDAQELYCCQQREYRDDFSQHLGAFASATLQSCEQLASRLLVDKEKAVRKAEEEYIIARQKLVESGIPIPLRRSSQPGTPETFDDIARERSDRGEVGKRDKPPSEPGLDGVRVNTIDRRCMNDWRAAAALGVPAAASSHEAQSTTSMPSSWRSASGSGSSERQRLLREYEIRLGHA